MACTLVGRSVPALEAGDGGCRVVFMPFLKPLMPQTHTVPGFRLGPDLPSRSCIGLYTRLPLPILNGVWHKQGGVWGGGVYCAVVVQYFCNSADIADARGQYKDVRLVHKSFGVKQYLV